MKQPLVSVVVAAHRRVDYLKEALASARAQTFTDFEIIVSDDGGSPEIAALVAALDEPRLRYHANARNLGIAMNHRAAYREAQGKYISNLDDDDVWEPTFLAELVPPLEADSSLTVAFCDHFLVDGDGQILEQRTNKNTSFYGRDSLAAGRHQPFRELAVVHESIPMAMAAVFRKTMLDRDEFPGRVGGSYDHWLAYLAARGDAAAYYVPRRLTRYRVHMSSGTLTRNRRNLRNCIHVRSRFAKDPELASFRSFFINSLGVCYGKLALCELDRGAFRKAWILAHHGFDLMNRPKNRLALLRNGVVHFFRALVNRPT